MKKFYFCHECKKMLRSSQFLISLEQYPNHYYCSKSCCEDFLYSLKGQWKNYLKNILMEENIDEEEVSLLNPSEVEITLKNPDHIYSIKNEFEEEVIVVIKEHNYLYHLIIAVFDNHNLLETLLNVKTAHSELLNAFSFGQKITQSAFVQKYYDVQKEERGQKEAALLEEFIETLENKKSTMLAELLGLVSANDIQIEDYAFYEPYFNQALNYPDEIFELKDKEGDLLNYLISSHSDKTGKIFFYVICALKKKNGNEERLFPVLGFPTRDHHLLSFYRKGKKVDKQHLN